ncbi:E3 ubiquitin/ISG15 ligase TRIM25-like [Bufo bufo]|uniref:E3 ubiquitin/ISG15 ligase TRIM25-like n=1 Tax=Bufo bufo TaxID=8384 RepID=UPI001ABECF55|nr:E3 ubiquitin/ISG15 ligase TRIM25-like [Bufo bufo]
MAAADLREELNCSLCLSIYKDPVTLMCGHNFCQECIDPVLNSQEGNGVYSCPNCREHLPERPALRKNSVLSNIAQRFQSLPPAEANVCAFCLPDEVPAVICCQHCEAFLCDHHLRFHSKSSKHVFSEPTTLPEHKRCSVHKKPLEYFCSVDSACLCVLCKQDCELHGHDLQSLDDAAKSKKKTLRNIYDKLSSKRGRAEEKIQSLKWHDKKINAKAIGITRRLNTMHIDMKEQLTVLFNDVLKEVSRQAEQMSLTLLDLIKHLEIEKDELYSKMDHVGQLFNVSDPVMVIQESKGNYFCNEDEEEDDEYDKEPYVMGDLDESLISQTLHEGLSNVMKVAQEIKDWREYTDLLLDIDTAGNYLHVSEDLKTVSWSKENWNRPETPQRFQSFQVLSIKCFSSGRHHWEVEMSKSGGWAVGMCYPSIERKGDLSAIGADSKSWGLLGFINKFFLRHDGKQMVVSPQNGSCCRLRIDLDYEDGQLSFSERDDSVRHLHTFKANFTEPLHAVFWVSGNKNQEDCVVRIKLCKKVK